MDARAARAVEVPRHRFGALAAHEVGEAAAEGLAQAGADLGQQHGLQRGDRQGEPVARRERGLGAAQELAEGRPELGPVEGPARGLHQRGRETDGLVVQGGAGGAGGEEVLLVGVALDPHHGALEARGGEVDVVDGAEHGDRPTRRRDAGRRGGQHQGGPDRVDQAVVEVGDHAELEPGQERIPRGPRHLQLPGQVARRRAVAHDREVEVDLGPEEDGLGALVAGRQSEKAPIVIWSYCSQGSLVRMPPPMRGSSPSMRRRGRWAKRARRAIRASLSQQPAVAHAPLRRSGRRLRRDRRSPATAPRWWRRTGPGRARPARRAGARGSSGSSGRRGSCARAGPA